MPKSSKKQEIRDNGHIQVQTRNERAQKDMARPSSLVYFHDEKFLDKFSKLFFEHVEGFTGLRRAKRVRTDKEKNMEWRVRLEEKRAREKDSNQPETGLVSTVSKSTTNEKVPKKKKTKTPTLDMKAREDAIAKYQKMKKMKSTNRPGR